MPTETFDAIVIGLGAHGSAAAAALARRELRVLGLDRFARGQTMGSSGGHSRMIRLAYFEDPAYVPLVRESWSAWRGLEDETGLPILTQTGGIYAGPAGSEIVDGSVRSARAHGIRHEVVDGRELARRWPVFAPMDDLVAVVDEEAGMIDADAAIAAHLAVAERAGSVLRFGARAVDWRPAAGGGFEVETDDGSVAGSSYLVIAAGPWMSSFVPDLGLPLAIEREPVAWFEPVVDPSSVALGRLPVWVMGTPEDGFFYGFPFDAEHGLKVSHHHWGVLTDAETIDREFRPADEARIRAFIRRRMPGADGSLRTSTVCMYTNTPDLRFVIDRHPAAAGVAYASACSGHGFKFAPVVGEVLADLVVGGSTARSIDAFRADRFRQEPVAG